MEPCLFRHGKILFEEWQRILARLQWSHVFSDMVSVPVDEIARMVVEASMEPCLFRHGKGPEPTDVYY